MQKGNRYSRARKTVVEAAIAAFVLITLSYELHAMADGCRLFENAFWVALEVLRPVIRAAWQSMSAYFGDDSGILQHVVQVATSIGLLLCAMVSLV